MRWPKPLAALALALLLVPACAEDGVNLAAPGWHGNAVAYSGYRAGQHPDTGPWPSEEQLVEDLRILDKNWKVIRLYDSGRTAEDVLRLIRREKLGLKVMLGAWVSGAPEKLNDNALEIVRVTRLANVYRDVVVAVNVGNEILVSWSDHRLSEPLALNYVAQVKQAVTVPVTIADDSLYWRDPAAKLADAVDFITLHTYPMWDRQDIDTAMASTIRVYEMVRAAHPGKTVVLGEAGWATYTDNPENFPRAGDEAKQARYYEDLNAWAAANGVTVFVFEAFDESWKGSGTEGHWGLFSETRKAKPVMQKLYPELTGPEPTSPAYADAAPPSVGVPVNNKDKK